MVANSEVILPTTISTLSLFPENGVLKNFVDRGLNLPIMRLFGQHKDQDYKNDSIVFGSRAKS
jgi:hypothetical protein